MNENYENNRMHEGERNISEYTYYSQPIQRPNGEPKKAGKGKKIGSLIGSGLVFGLVAGVTFQGIQLGTKAVTDFIGIEETTQASGNNTTASNIASVNTGTSSITQAYDVSDMAENVMPSIVSITNISVETVQTWFERYEQEVEGSGSGIIIGQDVNKIYIVTNYHVIEDNKRLTVVFSDEEAVNATVKGYDEEADLAVIEVNLAEMKESTINTIKIAEIGNSDDVRVGEPAIAIGNALGYGQTLTGGYISAVNREVSLSDGGNMTLIQTDAAINPGNSGGALLNIDGQVIGINTIKLVDSTVEGMGYAIPISDAMPIIEEIMNQSSVENASGTDSAQDGIGFLGFQGKTITQEYAAELNMPQGVYVSGIVNGSPAATAGLWVGDIIVACNGEEVEQMEEVQQIITGMKPGDTISITVLRKNKMAKYETVEITATLGNQSDYIH